MRGSDSKCDAPHARILSDHLSLFQLAEILVEHFERKKAVNESTRVIVFSQWRDSVEGIVAMLSSQHQSFLKPSQFIGQSKKSAGTKGKKAKGADVGLAQQDTAGMNQAQQQKVLEQFSKGIFNILVCTCVAEEGLDISEVDLIVNFDILKSPIRNIQRSGRTGRKRNGRVIFLVSEGQEERSYRESVTNTKKIARALQSNRNVFKFCPNNPMMPKDPALYKQKMLVNTFRMSQVGGHTPRGRGDKKQSRGSGGGGAGMPEGDWRLTNAQEEKRESLFGYLPQLSCQDHEKQSDFPQSIRRKYLKSRERSAVVKSFRRGSKSTVSGLGRTVAVLRNFERQFPVGVSNLSLSPVNVVVAAKNAYKGHQPIDLVDTDSGSAAMDVCSVQSFGGGQHDPFLSDGSVQSISSNHDNPLEAIFGTINDTNNLNVEGCVNMNQLSSLFDSSSHKRCAVTPPPPFGMLLDRDHESDKDSSDSSVSASSKASQLSVDTMDDDLLCEYFEKKGSSDFGGRLDQESTRRKKFESSNQVDEGDFSDGFGGNDDFEFGTPREDTFGNNDEADTSEGAVNDYPIGTDGGLADLNVMRSPTNNVSIQRSSERSPNHPSTSEGSSKCKHDGVADAAAAFDLEQLNEKLTALSPIVGSPKIDAEVQEVVAFQLPTPPDSSDDESEDDQSNAQDRLPGGKPDVYVDFKIDINADLVQHPNESARNAERDRSHDEDEQQRNENIEDNVANLFLMDEDTNVDNFAIPLQLPTQYSSSSGSDDESSESSECTHPGFPADTSQPPRTPNDLFDDADGSPPHAARDENQNIPSSSLRRTNQTQSPGYCLTDTPVVSEQPNRYQANNSVSHDDLTDTPINQSRRRVLPSATRPSLDSLSDTPIKTTQIKDEGPKRLGMQRKRLRPAPSNNKENNLTPTSNADKTEKVDRKERVRKRVEEKYRCRFLDAEAANDDSEEDSDEEDAIKWIEEDEAQNSFINDSSQLGYSQDDLDRLNADDTIQDMLEHGESVLHRQFNHKQNVADQFKTPVFNRRMRAPLSQGSEPQSQRGLGKMNFIRSVLEHHRAGGDSNELEDEYHRLVGQSSSHDQSQETSEVVEIDDSPARPKQPPELQQMLPPTCRSVPSMPPPRATFSSQPQQQINPYAEGAVSQPFQQRPALTAEQKALIQSNRQEALRRRQMSVQQQRQQKKATMNAK